MPKFKTVKTVEVQCDCGHKFKTDKVKDVQCYKCKAKFDLI